jgi:4-amino-4-deoxychorismate lyase
VRPRALAVSGRGLVEPTTPVLVADDEGFTRGRAAFETMRVYAGTPFRLAEHLDRLVGSAERVGLPPVERGEVERLVVLALDAAGLADATLRVFWTAGPPGGPPSALVMVGELPAWIEGARRRGVRLVSLLGVRASAPWLLPGTKSTSYAVNIAAEEEARRRGADDAVFVDDAGIVLEGPVTNVWWRVGDTLHTPALELGILAGETRATVIALAADLGYAVAEGVYPLAALAAAEEAFTSSSIREVMPVAALDGAVLPRGPAAERLQRALRGLAGGTLP